MINYNADHDDITPYTPAKKYQVSMVIVSMSVSRHLYTPQSSYLPYLLTQGLPLMFINKYDDVIFLYTSEGVGGRKRKREGENK